MQDACWEPNNTLPGPRLNSRSTLAYVAAGQNVGTVSMGACWVCNLHVDPVGGRLGGCWLEEDSPCPERYWLECSYELSCAGDYARAGVQRTPPQYDRPI